MKQVLIVQGRANVEEVPDPLVEPGTVLVRTAHSCISIGTEMTGLKLSGTPLWKRAMNEPEAVARVVQMAASQGISRTWSMVRGTLGAGQATGYSAAGRVVEVGEGIDDLRPGDRVACAGAQCAYHAELIRVPRNLTVPIPDGLGTAEASTVTLGAIALQGVRRASPTLGETFVVLGLGLLGQLTCQLLKASGCRVIGTDLDRARIALAASLGMAAGVHPDDGSQVEQVARLTDGLGADGVIITAAGPSDEIVSHAFQMCRKKGRVVLVGDVGLNLNRADFYQKEIDFLISTSYGPGRYDRNYEERGLDYPVAYVRWTENRNLREYLRLLAEEKVTLGPLLGAEFPLDKAQQAYASLESGDAVRRPLLVLLAYPEAPADASPCRAVVNRLARARGGRIRMAVVGAGGFAKGMHLPNLQSLARQFEIHSIVSRTGHNAVAAARQFNAVRAATDFQVVLDDPEVDAVLIATRHDLHASMALRALEAGKHVLLEKPLALNRSELDNIVAFYGGVEATGDRPLLLTGFNRRFSPHLLPLAEAVRARTGPFLLDYRMNAGYLPPDHWVHQPEGGGRNLGEACHIYDLMVFLTGRRAAGVSVSPLRPASQHYSLSDNFVASVRFEDGSVATLTYTSLGTAAFPKEQMEIFCDGKVLALDDYRKSSLFGLSRKGTSSRIAAKGHLEELQAFAAAIHHGGPWPIPLWQQVEATHIALEVQRQLDAAGEST